MVNVKMFAAPGATSCSFAGFSYEVIDGVVEVPETAVETLTSHGFATSRDTVGQPFQAATPEAMLALGAKLTEAKVEAAQLRGSVEAMQAERDAARARVSELEAQVLAQGRSKR